MKWTKESPPGKPIVMRSFTRSLILLAFFGQLGCVSVSFKSDDVVDYQARYEEHYDNWLFGFVSNGKANVTNACPGNRVARIRSFFSPEDLLISTFLVALYLPRTTEITCAREENHVSTP